MKKTTLTLLMTVFTASSLFSTVTQADGPPGQTWHQQGGQGGSNGHGGPDGHGGQGGSNGHGGPDGHGGQGGPGGHGGPDGHGGHGDHGHDNQGANRHFDERDHFAWQGHDFRRGEPLPPNFRDDNYRVDDWRNRGLAEPPHGEHWAYIDGNYVLIAAATGVITSILLNNAFHH
ncbi:hypothetical protein EH228_17320 [Erwinia endophytica]|uniref:RcnB family protein n=1 Tax=Erwinia endophytica TaxID=1563158 RepID=UPI001265F856|nr:RcnB family protein [Erwinia endophytica]KAB8306628.1 hypothetical protein EH228_17320 [Erwinia endophytica]